MVPDFTGYVDNAPINIFSQRGGGGGGGGYRGD